MKRRSALHFGNDDEVAMHVSHVLAVSLAVTERVPAEATRVGLGNNLGGGAAHPPAPTKKHPGRKYQDRLIFIFI